MSRFSGRQYEGAARDARTRRREQAEERNARTPLERRSRKVGIPAKIVLPGVREKLYRGPR